MKHDRATPTADKLILLMAMAVIALIAAAQTMDYNHQVEDCMLDSFADPTSHAELNEIAAHCGANPADYAGYFKIEEK